MSVKFEETPARSHLFSLHKQKAVCKAAPTQPLAETDEEAVEKDVMGRAGFIAS